MPSCCASNSPRIFCSPYVPFPMYLRSGTEWILSRCKDSFSSTLLTPLSTVSATVRMTLWYIRASATVAFWWVTAVFVPLAFLFAIIIRMWAGAFWCKSALLIADEIFFSILLGGGTLSSLLNIRRLSAIRYPAVGAGPGPEPMGAL